MSPATKECAILKPPNMHIKRAGSRHFNMLLNSFNCLLRFGVIHAVFTNLLLWCSGVMSEAEHFLSNHIRRLSALGYENLTIGKGQGVDCWLVPGRRVQ